MKINDEFKAIIPPLTNDEFSQLEKNCIKDGILETIKTWNGFIVDGHNRYEIAQKNNLTFDTLELEFESEDAAKVWMIDNQKGRRNLTDGWKWELAQTKKTLLNAKGKENIIQAQKERHSGVSLSTIDKDRSHNTRNEIAKELGWSTGKVAMTDKVWRQAKPEVKDKIKSGETTINQAYQEIKKGEKIEKRKAEIEETKKKIESEPQTLEGLFDVIVIDPPWAYGRDYNPETSRVANPYPEMQTSEIAKIELPIKDNAVVFLWTTHAFIQDAFSLLKAWGLNYKATIVWDKERMGIGATIRMQCEFCLLAVIGKPVIQGSSERDIIREARREHSRKPEAFYNMVERMCIGRKLDYFSREKRDNWFSYGAETEKF